MNTVVVATDFSPPAENAMLFAGSLAELAGASVLLVHAYQVPVSMNDAPALVIEADDIGAHTELNLQRAKASFQKQYPQVQIKTESRLGDVVDELKFICRDVQPLFLVQGRHHKNGVESLLFGNTSLSIIRHCKSPLISVPDSASTAVIKNIGIAIDASDGPLQKATSILKTFNAALHVVHIKEKEEKLLDRADFPGEWNATFTNVSSEGFVEGIHQFVQRNSIDLLCIFPHRHSVVERLLFKTHTAQLMNKLSLPILCIPD
jgi:nucleotide-binding universal stress UspA family protein